MQPCLIEWITIPAPDLPAADRFYSSVFGFTVSDHNPRYKVFKAGNLSGGLDQDLPSMPGGIGFSVTVPDIRQTLELVIAHGGSVVKEPQALDDGCYAAISDPNGNRLEVYGSSTGAG